MSMSLQRSWTRTRCSSIDSIGHEHRRARAHKLSAMSVMGSALKVHEAIYKATDGLLGHRMIGVPCLLLRSTGRRTGQTRTNSLVYARDGEDYLLVASNGGAERHPAWLHNLKAHPDVEIQIGRRRRPGSARVIDTSDPESDRRLQIV